MSAPSRNRPHRKGPMISPPPPVGHSIPADPRRKRFLPASSGRSIYVYVLLPAQVGNLQSNPTSQPLTIRTPPHPLRFCTGSADNVLTLDIQMTCKDLLFSSLHIPTPPPLVAHWTFQSPEIQQIDPHVLNVLRRNESLCGGVA